MYNKRSEQQAGANSNTQVCSTLMKKFYVSNAIGQTLLKAAMDKLKHSAHIYDRILNTSHTVADLKLENT